MGNGIGISKIEPLFLDTNDVRCSISAVLNYNITQAFLVVDSDKDGRISTNEFDSAANIMGIQPPIQTEDDDLAAFRDYIISKALTPAGIFDVDDYFPSGSGGSDEASNSLNLIIIIVSASVIVIMVIILVVLAIRVRRQAT